MEKQRDRKWTMILYPEDPTHKSAMEKLELGGYKYVAILHDSDVWEEGESENHVAGEPKKEHWHVVLKFPQARWNTALSDELGIPINYFQKCANFDAACLYLVHANAENKHQYDPAALFGTLVHVVNKLLADDDEGVRVLEIVKQIDARPGRASYRDILVWACKNGYYGEFRRLGIGVSALIREHNEEFDSSFLNKHLAYKDLEKFQRYAEFMGDKDITPL